jgi:hypothetical protein
MQDIKLNQRLKQYNNGKVFFNIFIETSEKTLNDSRLNYSLSLRKNNLLNKLMQKRHNTSLKFLKTSELKINLKSLNVDRYKTEINNYDNLNFPYQKCLFLINELTQNINYIDILNVYYNIFSQDKSLFHNTKDYIKYCLKKLDNFLTNYKEEDLNIQMNEDFLKKIFSELITTNDLSVQFTILEIFVTFSSKSKYFNEFISQNRYIGYLFQFTYMKNSDIIFNILYILFNILSDFPSNAEIIIINYPYHIRIKELIYEELDNENNVNNIIEYIEILTKIISSIEEDSYEKFKDLIIMIYELFQKIPNQKLRKSILELLIQLSKDDEISKEIISCGFGSTLQNILSEKYCEREYLNNLLEIMINIVYNNDIAQFLLNSNILNNYIKILNTYRNTANKDDDEIIYLCIFFLSNIAGGTTKHIHFLIVNNLPSLILDILKTRNGNKIYFETCNFFYNILQNCSSEDFCVIVKLKVMKLFCEGLNKTFVQDDILICLKGILSLIERNFEIYKTKQNLKNEFFGYAAKKYLEKLAEHQDKQISSLSSQLLNIMGEQYDEDLI